MLCGRNEADLNGLSKFDKQKLIQTCEYTIKQVEKAREFKLKKEADIERKRLLAIKESWERYLPWNWWLTGKTEEDLTYDVCLDSYSSHHEWTYLDLLDHGHKKIQKAKRILNLCKRSDSNAIYLDGNDARMLLWPADDGKEETVCSD